jgi:aspartyl-tRNA(Asn)/glutamyl-tRNA(Gln) amidotransferase subunit A
VLAGYDPLDAASVAAPAEDYVASMEQSVAAVRLGAPAEFYVELDPEVESAMKAATQVLSELTAGVSSTAPLPPCGDILHFFAETLAFHAKYIEQTLELYQSATGRFLKSFPPPLATHYIQARETLTALRRTIDSAFDTFDLVILPTERVLPTTIAAAEESDRIAEETGVPSTDTYVAIANTYQFNLYGLPALTMPCGFSKEGLPIGMTIAGPRFSEGKILALAKAFESATDWHTRTPALSA